MTILHRFGNALRELLGLVPLGAVRVIFLGCLLLVLLWVLRLPKDRVTPENGTGRWDENLKVGAVLALVLQLIVYSIL